MAVFEIDEDSDEAFSRSPRAAKRQRISTIHDEASASKTDMLGNAMVSDDRDEYGSDFDEDDYCELETLPVAKDSDHIFDIPKKPKHRIHIPEVNGDELPDSFISQAPSSSPGRLRGPIWLKSPLTRPAPPAQPTRLSAFRLPMQAPSADTIKSGVAVPMPARERPSAHAMGDVPAPNARTAVRHEKPIQITSSAANGVIDNELADLPSDAFQSSSSPAKSPNITRQPNLRGLQSGLRQTTLFGGAVQPSASPVAKKRAFPLVSKQEAPTHHTLNQDALSTWVYPTNLGTIRDYQYNIVARGLFNNLLVALPTGLGKTFIAATIMLNWFRWTTDAQIVFVAPTKPLVAQQVDACFNIAGIPRSQTVMLTGTVAPGLRAEEWKDKRVFFMTPQTIMNDLKTGIADPKKIVLVVVDEAHRATGGYAYVELVRFLRRFNQSFRVLALTATPGSKVESVQEVIDGLDISRIEIRTESSIDIRQYVHSKETDSMVFDYSEEQEMIMDLFSKALQPVLAKLNSQNGYWSKDPMKLTAYGMTMAQQAWNKSEAGRKAPPAIKGMMFAVFSVLASLAHSISMLKFHGIGPFFRTVASLKSDVDSKKNKSKYALQICQSESFERMYHRIDGWIRNPDFIGHPKLEYLREVVLNHFMDAGEGKHGAPPSATRVMVFARLRDSVEEIVRVLKRNEPMVRPHVFVGQADAKASEGMGQKQQLEVIQKFKDGIYNTLVATSIAEEGLDIGEIDLIICYDASSSPISMLQRMGRTGRKRKGNVVMLLMRDKEEKDFEQAKDNYEKMQAMISSGTRFTFHDDRSPRILPKDVQPLPDKRVVEIPVENSQADLPEPKKNGRRAPKRPPKKFHMPDNVRTGFTTASRMDDDDDGDEEESAEVQSRPKARQKKAPAKKRPALPKVEPEPEPAQLPFLEDVLLNKIQERELERKYQYVNDADDAQTVTAPRPDKFPDGFRTVSATKYVGHGRTTTRIASMLQAVRDMDDCKIQAFKDRFHKSDLGRDVEHLIGEVNQPVDLQDQAVSDHEHYVHPTPKAKKGRRGQYRRSNSAAMEGESSSPDPTPANMRIGTQGIDLGSDDTSGEEDVDGEPDSELAEFVVASDQPVEFASSSMPFPDETPAQGRFYVSQEVGDRDESEDDLPEVAMVTVASRTPGARNYDGHRTANGKKSAEVPRRRLVKKRQIIEEDSEEE